MVQVWAWGHIARASSTAGLVFERRNTAGYCVTSAAIRLNSFFHSGLRCHRDLSSVANYANKDHRN